MSPTPAQWRRIAIRARQHAYTVAWWMADVEPETAAQRLACDLVTACQVLVCRRPSDRAGVAVIAGKFGVDAARLAALLDMPA